MPKWTDEELNILREYYPKGGVKLVKEKGVDRSSEAIKVRASQMGLNFRDGVIDRLRSKWSKSELKILVDYYPDEGLDVVSRLKNRSERAIQVKASQMGLKLHNELKKEVTNMWTQEEVDLLYKYYESCGARHIKSLGVYRSVYAIVSKANKLGLKREIV